jgi:cyclic pyranopterin phosphate synthase
LGAGERRRTGALDTFGSALERGNAAQRWDVPLYNDPMTDEKDLTHLDEGGRARMVDVGGKPTSDRWAVARGHVLLSADTLALVEAGDRDRGSLAAVVETAGVMAAKRTSELIPHCHPLPLSHIDVAVRFDNELPGAVVEATARTRARTGVEMEALTAVAVAALTLYDMVKAVEREARITDIRLVEKHGGKSGDLVLEDE